MAECLEETPIFFKEIFEYLGLEDIISLWEVSPRMAYVADHYMSSMNQTSRNLSKYVHQVVQNDDYELLDKAKQFFQGKMKYHGLVKYFADQGGTMDMFFTLRKMCNEIKFHSSLEKSIITAYDNQRQELFDFLAPEFVRLRQEAEKLDTKFQYETEFEKKLKQFCLTHRNNWQSSRLLNQRLHIYSPISYSISEYEFQELEEIHDRLVISCYLSDFHPILPLLSPNKKLVYLIHQWNNEMLIPLKESVSDYKSLLQDTNDNAQTWLIRYLMNNRFKDYSYEDYETVRDLKNRSVEELIECEKDYEKYRWRYYYKDQGDQLKKKIKQYQVIINYYKSWLQQITIYVDPKRRKKKLITHIDQP